MMGERGQPKVKTKCPQLYTNSVGLKRKIVARHTSHSATVCALLAADMSPVTSISMSPTESEHIKSTAQCQYTSKAGVAYS